MKLKKTPAPFCPDIGTRCCHANFPCSNITVSCKLITHALKLWMKKNIQWAQKAFRKKMFCLCMQIPKLPILNSSRCTGMKRLLTDHSLSKTELRDTIRTTKVYEVGKICIYFNFRTNYTCSRVECVTSEIKMLFENVQGD